MPTWFLSPGWTWISVFIKRRRAVLTVIREPSGWWRTGLEAIICPQYDWSWPRLGRGFQWNPGPGHHPPDFCIWADWILTQGCQDPEVHSQALFIALSRKFCSDLSETRRKKRKRSSKTVWQKGNLRWRHPLCSAPHNTVAWVTAHEMVVFAQLRLASFLMCVTLLISVVSLFLNQMPIIQTDSSPFRDGKRRLEVPNGLS